MRKKLKEIGGIDKVTDMDKLKEDLNVPLEMKLLL